MQRNDLLGEAKDLYDVVAEHYRKTDYEAEFPLSPIWFGANREVMEEIFRTSADAVEAIKRLQSYWFQQVPPKKTAELAIEWHINALAREGISFQALPEFCQESEFAPDETVLVSEGRRLRPDIFRHLGTILRFQRIAGKSCNVRRVLELGGGTGNFARLFKLFYPKTQYVIVDLPETLCFSYMYLRLNFPDARYLFLTDQRDLLNEDLKEWDFIFCPTSLENTVFALQFDLFVNTASLGEMKRKVVEYWFSVIQTRVNPKYILSVNRYLNTMLVGVQDWRLDENTSAFHYDTGWKILDWECEPFFVRCPFNNKHARYLMIIAERSASDSIDDCQAVSTRLLEEARAGSWNDPPLAMTCQDNALVSDLTMSGVLFKLWEALRLNETPEALFTMLTYLDTLIHRDDRHFEDFFQYCERLERLHRASPELATEEAEGFLRERCHWAFLARLQAR